MRSLHPIYLICLGIFFFACSESESPNPDLGLDYHPLQIGLYWEYQVEETIVFGEGDAEEDSFFYRDQIISSFTNAEGREVFVLARQKSPNRENWQTIDNFTRQVVNLTLVQQIQNQSVVSLVFPPNEGRSWDASVFSSSERDQFEIVQIGTIIVGNRSFDRAVKVLHENEDDEITFRNHRFEVFARGIGMVEHYFEVFTYCSRNDCLGQKILDSGRKTHLILIAHGKV